MILVWKMVKKELQEVKMVGDKINNYDKSFNTWTINKHTCNSSKLAALLVAKKK